MRDPKRFIPPSTPPEVLGLREGVDAPDLSDAILGEVERRRGWLSPRQRRLVCAARWAAGFALLATFAGILLVQRAAPVDEAIAPRDRPIADLMQNFKDETSIAVQTVSTQMRSLPGQLVNQSHEIVTGRIERHGAQRIVELNGPVSVVGEGSHERMPIDGLFAAGGTLVPAGENADRLRHAGRTGETTYRTISGGAWSAQVPVTLDADATLFEAEGLEDEQR